MRNKNKITEIEAMFSQYLFEIDDYYDAKDEFIKDLNSVFHAHGCKGVISRDKFSEALLPLNLLK